MQRRLTGHQVCSAYVLRLAKNWIEPIVKNSTWILALSVSETSRKSASGDWGFGCCWHLAACRYICCKHGTSICLHLNSLLSRYNSAVFAQTTVSAYNVFVGREDFLQGASFDSRHSDNTYISYPDEEIYWLRNNTDRLHRLEVDECIDAYANAQPSLRSDVILVSSSTADNNGSLLADFAFDPGKL